MIDDRLQSAAFQFAAMVRDSDPKRRLLRVPQNAVAAGSVMNNKSGASQNAQDFF